MGIKIIQTTPKNGRVCLSELMTALGKMKIDSVLIEAGAELNAAAFCEGIVDCYQLYIAPKLIGGRDAKTAIGGKGIPLLADAIRLSKPKISHFDGDILLEYSVIKE